VADYELLRFEHCDSTNDYLKQLLPTLDSCQLPLAVLAAEQSAGHGRLGRSWSSPAGGIYLSLLLPQPVNAVQAACLPLVMALAARSVMQLHTEYRLAIKWPNDLLAVTPSHTLGKLAGILVELVDNRAIIGIGVNAARSAPQKNVELAVDEAATDTAEPAKNDGGLAQVWLDYPHLQEVEIARQRAAQLAEPLLNEMLGYIARWQSADHSFADFVDEYNANLVQLNQPVQVFDASAALLADGIALGVDEIGRLLVQTETGLVRVATGDVTLRK